MREMLVRTVEALDQRPAIVVGSCLLLTALVCVAIVFFGAFDSEANVIYGRF